MSPYTIILGDSRSDQQSAEQASYLAALLACSLLLTGFNVAVFGYRPLFNGALAALASLLVELVFAWVRKKPVTGGGCVYGLVLSLLAPPDIAWWILLLGAIFGTVFGKEAFGGAKNAIFNPALVGLGFMFFSYPADTVAISLGNLATMEGAPQQFSIMLILACLAIIIIAKPTSLSIYIPMAFAVYLIAAYLIPTEKLPMEGNLQQIFSNDNFLLIAVLLAADPGNAPRKWHGKIIYGIVVGTLAILMRCFSKYQEAMMFAILFGNTIAPSLDMIGSNRIRKEDAK